MAEVGLPLEGECAGGAGDPAAGTGCGGGGILGAVRFESVSRLEGRRAVVRNGRLPEREILPAVAPVTVEVPGAQQEKACHASRKRMATKLINLDGRAGLLRTAFLGSQTPT